MEADRKEATVMIELKRSAVIELWALGRNNE